MPGQHSEALPLDYRGYRIYARAGTPIWEKNPVSGFEFVANRTVGRGFLIERLDPSKPPVRSLRQPSTLDAAKQEVDFLIKFGTYDHPGEVPVHSVAPA